MFMVFYQFLLSIVALVLGILAYNKPKAPALFYAGIVASVLTIISIAPYYKFFIYVSVGWIVLACLATAVLFLGLSKSNNKSGADDVTDAFLDDIINSQDEEWDTESGMEERDYLNKIIESPDEEWNPES